MEIDPVDSMVHPSTTRPGLILLTFFLVNRMSSQSLRNLKLILFQKPKNKQKNMTTTGKVNHQNTVRKIRRR